MKKYVKAYNYTNLDENIDELIRDFDAYIIDVDTDESDPEWVSVLIGDHNSDFSEWVDVKLYDNREIDYWEWNRTIFNLMWDEEKNLQKIMTDDSVMEQVYYVLDYYFETGVIDE